MLYSTASPKAVPGYWENNNKDSTNDFVSENPTVVSALQKMLQAAGKYPAVDQLTDKAIAAMSKQVSERINRISRTVKTMVKNSFSTMALPPSYCCWLHVAEKKNLLILFRPIVGTKRQPPQFTTMV